MVSGAGVTTSVKPLDTVFFTLSVTVIVNEYDPTVVAVPLSVPALKLVPVGAVPLRLNTKGGTPPVAANAIPIEEPTWTLLKGPVVMTRGAGTMVTEMVADALLFAGSEAVTPKEKEPDAVGVPCNCPLFDNCKPGGKPPALPVTINV
jgi:hypothetical protein